MSSLDIRAIEAFNCNTDGNLASECQKWKKRLQYYVATAGLSDNKQKQTTLLYLIGPAGNFQHCPWFRRQLNSESAIASLDIYFMPKKNLIYECYYFFKCQPKVLMLMHLGLLTKSCDYGGFEEETITNHTVMSCNSSRLHQKDLSVGKGSLCAYCGKRISLLNFSKQLHRQWNYQWKGGIQQY